MEKINRIKVLREKAGISQEKLAELLSTGRSTVVKLERGERPLTIDWIERIAPLIGCAPWEMLPENKTQEDKEMEIRLRWRSMDEDVKEAVLSISKQLSGGRSG